VTFAYVVKELATFATLDVANLQSQPLHGLVMTLHFSDDLAIQISCLQQRDNLFFASMDLCFFFMRRRDRSALATTKGMRFTQRPAREPVHPDSTFGTEGIAALTRRAAGLPLSDQLPSLPKATANLYPSRNMTTRTREILAVSLHRLETSDTPGIERSFSPAPVCV
jgi:hypothetical protein